MKLYDSSLAPNPRRLRIFMAEKGIECEKVELNIVNGENLTEEFLAINPRGLLPTLILDDGTVLDESVAICRYLEELQPEPCLMGNSPLSKAQIEARQRQMEFDGLMSAAEAFRNSFPGFAKRGLSGNHPNVDAIPALAERGKASMERFYQQLNEHLADSKYVCGDDFSIADITAVCTIDFAKTAARCPVPEGLEHLDRWYNEVSSRPSASA